MTVGPVARRAKEYSAGGVVTKAGKLLLVKVRNLSGRLVWTFPKGHLEGGESAREAALREVEEETGWRCEIVEALMTARYTFRRGGTAVDKRVRWFWMRPDRKVGRPDEQEVLQTRWRTPGEAGGALAYDSDLKLLRMMRGRIRG